MTRPSIDVKRVGREQTPVVVIDDCFADPAGWRIRAANADYETLGEFYPGVRAPVPAGYAAELGPLLGTILRRVFGFSVKAQLDRAFFSIVTTDADCLTLAQRIPHIDGVDDGLIAIIHFLAEQDQGGTAFYRHRSTGYETIDSSRHADYLEALRGDMAHHGFPAPAYIDGDTNLFERTDCIDGIYNRAIIYPSNLLHCSATHRQNGFLASPKQGRLTITGFLSAE